MNFSAIRSSPDELNPWLIILGDKEDTQLALWRIKESEADSIALFSSEEAARNYAGANCLGTCRPMQMETNALLRVFADCFRNGVHYATLDPSTEEARQVFLLRDVLSAAKDEVRRALDEQAG